MTKLTKQKCKRCGHKWIARMENPKVCPRCKSPYWDVKKVLQEKIR